MSAPATLDALDAAYAEDGEAGARAVLKARGLVPEPRCAVTVGDVKGKRPAPLLRLGGSTGAVVSNGTLSGEGECGKSALVASLALSLANRGEGEVEAPGDEPAPLPGGLFMAPKGGGPVVIASWEDSPAVTRWRIEAAAIQLGDDDESLDAGDVYLMDMSGAPIYGPRAGDDGERPGLYNARPEPLPGWANLWREVGRIMPCLVVIDPVLAAFVGNSNEAAPVREFLSALAVKATAHDCAVLLVAHSTKAARKGQGNAKPDPFDPGHVGGSAAWTDGVRSALVLGWDDERGSGARRLAVAKSNYGPARVLMPLEAVRVGGDDASNAGNAGAVVAFRAAGTWEADGAGDADRTIDALATGIKALRKAHPGADLAKLENALSASLKGRKAGDNGGVDAVDDEAPLT